MGEGDLLLHPLDGGRAPLSHDNFVGAIAKERRTPQSVERNLAALRKFCEAKSAKAAMTGH
jgi:hypothetical protein